MKQIELKQLEHNVKIGDVCGHIQPNVTEDSIFMFEGAAVGFYIKDISKHSERLAKLIDLANAEFRSSRVPKSLMTRSSALNAKRSGDGQGVEQYSTIIGSIPPKPHMKRPYPSISSVHSVKSAKNFISAMLLIGKECEYLIKELTPEIYDRQLAIIEKNIPEKWRFGKLFTSSISNYNISAAFHRDAGTLEGCVNVIIAKKYRATGGNTTVPDYGATVDSCDNSILVYPAWRNVHGVTPIVLEHADGYRNSLVFYPLKAFKGLE